MKNWRTVIVVFASVLIFGFIKFYFKPLTASTAVVEIILTAASILFGFLAGFFISELWSRYAQIRELQGVHSSKGKTMLIYAAHFFINKKFETDFKLRVEKSSVVNEVIDWDEGHLEFPYFYDIEKSFKHIKIKTREDELYYDHLLDSYNSFVQTSIRLDTLYKERLFVSEWFMMLVLSLMICASILFLDVTHVFYKAIVVLFPAIVVLALSVLYDLDTLKWSRGLLTIEPTQLIFDALGVKRFYLKKNKKYIDLKRVKNYRTEDDLTGELKQAYLDILKQRN